MSLFIALALLILMLAVVIGVVFVERAQRRIPIQYAKRQVGRKMYGGQSTHLPLRVNTAGLSPHLRFELAVVPRHDGEFRDRRLAEDGGVVVYAVFHLV